MLITLIFYLQNLTPAAEMSQIEPWLSQNHAGYEWWYDLHGTNPIRLRVTTSLLRVCYHFAGWTKSASITTAFKRPNHQFARSWSHVHDDNVNKTRQQKPNFITLAGSKLVRSWSQTGSKQVRTK